MKKDLHTDTDLVAKVRSGDKKAFDLIYGQYWLKLYRVASRITDDASIAQDIIQETFISFWEKGCYQDIRSIEAYLYQTVKFRCFMHLRSGKISKKHLDHFAALVTGSVDIDSIELRDLEDALEKGIASLPEKCREVFRLSRFESLPNKTIAEKLQISPKTVENQITKALKQLRLSIDKLVTLLLFLSTL